MAAHADFVCKRCHDTDPETAGPFINLPLGKQKPRCPNCGARRWMEQQFSGYSPLVSSERGRSFIAASEKLGEAGYDDQKARRAALLRRSNNPNAPRIVAPHMVGQAMAAVTGGRFTGIPGAVPGTTTLESLRPIQREGGVATAFRDPRPGPGSLVAPDKMPT